MLIHEDINILAKVVNTHPWGYIYSCKGFDRILTFALMLIHFIIKVIWYIYIYSCKGFDRILTFALMLIHFIIKVIWYIYSYKGFVRILTQEDLKILEKDSRILIHEDINILAKGFYN
jgi:energy-converting hydrogenase Eha subunit F